MRILSIITLNIRYCMSPRLERNGMTWYPSH